MRPSFNTAGPCVPADHYMLSPEHRFQRVMELIDDRKYFTLHAGHQTGKTTGARWLVKHYRANGPYACSWIDIQTARENPDPSQAFPTVLYNMHAALARDLPSIPQPEWEPLLTEPNTAILRFVRALSAQAPRPLVLLIDEVDGLVGPQKDLGYRVLGPLNTL